MNGDPDPSPQLLGLADSLVREHPERDAGRYWDAAWQTLTLQLTGDVRTLPVQRSTNHNETLAQRRRYTDAPGPATL